MGASSLLARQVPSDVFPDTDPADDQ